MEHIDSIRGYLGLKINQNTAPEAFFRQNQIIILTYEKIKNFLPLFEHKAFTKK